jgi:hypothetical protein
MSRSQQSKKANTCLTHACPGAAPQALRLRDQHRSVRSYLIAVGTPITGRPPHRTVRAAFPHTAPTSGV